MSTLFIRLNPANNKECDEVLSFLSQYDTSIPERITRDVCNRIQGLYIFNHMDKDKVIEVDVPSEAVPEVIDFIHTQTSIWWVRHEQITQAFYHRKDNMSQNFNVAAEDLKRPLQAINPNIYSDNNFRFRF